MAWSRRVTLRDGGVVHRPRDRAGMLQAAPMIAAAAMSWPTTSPDHQVGQADGITTASYQSPPTWSRDAAGRQRAASWSCRAAAAAASVSSGGDQRVEPLLQQDRALQRLGGVRRQRLDRDPVLLRDVPAGLPTPAPGAPRGLVAAAGGGTKERASPTWRLVSRWG